MFERVPAREPEHCVYALWRNLPRGCTDVAISPIHHRIRSQLASQRHARCIGSGRKHSRTPEFCQLDRNGADTARGAVNDQRFSAPQLQNIVDPLKRG
jgi:hypothetical protein